MILLRSKELTDKTGNVSIEVLKVVALMYCDGKIADKAKVLTNVLFPAKKVDLTVSKASNEWK